jgi:hypothetical protein
MDYGLTVDFGNCDIADGSVLLLQAMVDKRSSSSCRNGKDRTFN